jgi:dUTP pyrophosphatase
MSRFFEVCKQYENKDVMLPTRATKNSAGYDFYAAEDIVIPPFWKNFQDALSYKGKALAKEERSFKTVLDKVVSMIRPTLVATGVKASMQSDEYLQLCNRSSNPIKKLLLQANGIGVVDADYYSNPDNDGHIMFAFWNLSVFKLKIKKGEKIGQGIFLKFLTVDNDVTEGERTGGFGSTGN